MLEMNQHHFSSYPKSAEYKQVESIPILAELTRGMTFNTIIN